VTRIATLKAAGLSAEQILAVLEVEEVEEAEEAERASRRREQNRIAQKNTRSRRRQPVSDVSADPSDVADCTPSPAPPSSFPPNTPLSTPTSSPSPPSLRSGARASRGSRLPDDWTPSNDDLRAAEAILPKERIPIEVEIFRDHWHASVQPNARKADWSAAWRKWCHIAAERGLPLLRTINGGTNANNRRNGEAGGFAAYGAFNETRSRPG
jgi:hypothetical protein